MNILIRQARVVDPLSPYNGQIHDIYIENGMIKELAENLSASYDHEIMHENLHVSPGWIDIFSNFCDPGYEYKETLETGATAAASGGFTEVMVIPNTNPVLHSKANIEYIVQKAKTLPVNIYPLGAITKNTEGKELAEMYDMHSNGAKAFTDGINCLQSAGVMLKALQYIKAIDSTIIQLPDDKTINPQGVMNEGVVSMKLGLPGKPIMAEELVIERDIKLVQYTESKIHFTGISSKKSIDHIRQAKQSGLQVTCSVTPYHLFFSDDDLYDYDTNLKVNPPLRTIEDRLALWEAISDGTIDCITTHHLPHEYDSKMQEFEYAKYGMIGLETAFAALCTILPEISLQRWVELLSINPAKIFDIDKRPININNPVGLTLFDPRKTWTVTETGFKSKSKNSAFIGKQLSGKVIGIINKEQLFLSK